MSEPELYHRGIAAFCAEHASTDMPPPPDAPAPLPRPGQGYLLLSSFSAVTLPPGNQASEAAIRGDGRGTPTAVVPSFLDEMMNDRTAFEARWSEDIKAALEWDSEDSDVAAQEAALHERTGDGEDGGLEAFGNEVDKLLGCRGSEEFGVGFELLDYAGGVNASELEDGGEYEQTAGHQEWVDFLSKELESSVPAAWHTHVPAVTAHFVATRQHEALGGKPALYASAQGVGRGRPPRQAGAAGVRGRGGRARGGQNGKLGGRGLTVSHSSSRGGGRGRGRGRGGQGESGNGTKEEKHSEHGGGGGRRKSLSGGRGSVAADATSPNEVRSRTGKGSSGSPIGEDGNKGSVKGSGKTGRGRGKGSEGSALGPVGHSVAPSGSEVSEGVSEEKERGRGGTHPVAAAPLAVKGKGAGRDGGQQGVAPGGGCVWCGGEKAALQCCQCHHCFCYTCFRSKKGLGVRGWMAAQQMGEAYVCVVCSGAERDLTGSPTGSVTPAKRPAGTAPLGGSPDSVTGSRQVGEKNFHGQSESRVVREGERAGESKKGRNDVAIRDAGHDAGVNGEEEAEEVEGTEDEEEEVEEENDEIEDRRDSDWMEVEGRRLKRLEKRLDPGFAVWLDDGQGMKGAGERGSKGMRGRGVGTPGRGVRGGRSGRGRGRGGDVCV